MFDDLYAFIFTTTFAVSQKQTVRNLKTAQIWKEFQADKILLKQSEHIASFSGRNETQNWDVEGLGVACCPQDPHPWMCLHHAPLPVSETLAGPCLSSKGNLCGGIYMKSKPLTIYTISAFLFRMLPYPNILFWETSDLIKMVQRMPKNSWSRLPKGC